MAVPNNLPPLHSLLSFFFLSKIVLSFIFLLEATALWYMNSLRIMYVICLVVLPIEASFCLSIHNGFYYSFWWLTLVPKVVKLHTEYLLAKRSRCLFLSCSTPTLFVWVLGCLVIVSKKTCTRSIMGSYMKLIFYTLLYVLL